MSLVDIRVDLPSYSQTFTVKVPSSSSVSQLKQEIHHTCPGQPRPDGQRLIWRGRVLTDNESIDNLWKADPRVVHLAVHPSAWSSSPPEIPQSLPQSGISYQPNPISYPSYAPSYISPSRLNCTPAQSGPHPASTLNAHHPLLEYVRYLHQKALNSLCHSIPAPTEHTHGPHHRMDAIQVLQRQGWTWPAILDEPFPEVSEGGLMYSATIVEGLPYLQLSNASDNVQPTAVQQHALKVLSYTFSILYLSMNSQSSVRPTQPQQMHVPPHVNQLLQQLGLPPLRPAANNANHANQNNALLADLREIPVRALFAPLLMLLFRTVLLLYFFAPARKPIFGILILGWMLYEIWQPIRNGLRNGWARAPQNGQRQANNGQDARPGPGAAMPNAAQEDGARAAPRAGPAGPVTLEAQAGHIFDMLANLNIDEEQRILNPGPGGPPPEPTLGHKIVTFLSLFITTLHPAIWNRRRVALRRREGMVRTEANVRNAPPPIADNDSETAPSPAENEAAQRREQLRAQYGRHPRWIQRYMERVVAEDWVDDSD